MPPKDYTYEYEPGFSPKKKRSRKPKFSRCAGEYLIKYEDGIIRLASLPMEAASILSDRSRDAGIVEMEWIGERE